jgi:hypothetical protein
LPRSQYIKLSITCQNGSFSLVYDSYLHVNNAWASWANYELKHMYMSCIYSSRKQKVIVVIIACKITEMWTWTSERTRETDDDDDYAFMRWRFMTSLLIFGNFSHKFPNFFFHSTTFTLSCVDLITVIAQKKKSELFILLKVKQLNIKFNRQMKWNKNEKPQRWLAIRAHTHMVLCVKQPTTTMETMWLQFCSEKSAQKCLSILLIILEIIKLHYDNTIRAVCEPNVYKK